MFFDSHAHFDAFAEAGETEAVLERAAEAGVTRIMAVGGSPAGNRLALDLTEAHPGEVICCVGHDRYHADEPPPLAPLKDLLGQPGVAAVGEIGLDYHYSPGNREAQRRLFAGMLELAGEARLPVVVHSRDADDDTLELLARHVKDTGAEPGRWGVLHCFTGSRDFADRLLDLGMAISFSGIVTFRNAGPLVDVAAAVPGDRLLVETDAPYLAPVPFRGKRNEPAYLPKVAEALAKIRNDTVEHIAHITTRNATALFGRRGEGER